MMQKHVASDLLQLLRMVRASLWPQLRLGRTLLHGSQAPSPGSFQLRLPASGPFHPSSSWLSHSIAKRVNRMRRKRAPMAHLLDVVFVLLIPAKLRTPCSSLWLEHRLGRPRFDLHSSSGPTQTAPPWLQAFGLPLRRSSRWLSASVFVRFGHVGLQPWRRTPVPASASSMPGPASALSPMLASARPPDSLHRLPGREHLLWFRLGRSISVSTSASDIFLPWPIPFRTPASAQSHFSSASEGPSRRPSASMSDSRLGLGHLRPRRPRLRPLPPRPPSWPFTSAFFPRFDLPAGLLHWPRTQLLPSFLLPGWPLTSALAAPSRPRLVPCRPRPRLHPASVSPSLSLRTPIMALASASLASVLVSASPSPVFRLDLSLFGLLSRPRRWPLLPRFRHRPFPPRSLASTSASASLSGLPPRPPRWPPNFTKTS